MQPSVSPVPDGYQAVIPYLVVSGAAEILKFLHDAFGAEEKRCFTKPDGTIGHAEVRIGGSVIMLADACPEFPATKAGIHLYLPDVDAVYQRALRAGAESVQAPTNQFYGDRSATVRDRAGNWWCIATHIENLTDDEMRQRAQAAMG